MIGKVFGKRPVHGEYSTEGNRVSRLWMNQDQWGANTLYGLENRVRRSLGEECNGCSKFQALFTEYGKLGRSTIHYRISTKAAIGLLVYPIRTSIIVISFIIVFRNGFGNIVPLVFSPSLRVSHYFFPDGFICCLGLLLACFLYPSFLCK
ncbi:hypothetical protein BDV37DRAFT_223486 [Aspergillus pseudonomiae]|uniref:Uncharacterized protein n=1 Tax=Aspergillus pseudonomiae TaxID=1506151 RepID=A0A5N7DN22_9EURO|nr:uncharacterized protein BDV37DRAFT_223486 [Aspergillus pseudonomiae]KAE8407842.1 hypothetical protein BDV37DRAFT_223486 [Aspergillus pseudonomiae]